jgi:hypothetical protein
MLSIFFNIFAENFKLTPEFLDTTFHFTVLVHQFNALCNPSSQYHIQTSILSCSCHLIQAFTIAHHLSSTAHIQNHLKYILVQNGYLLGAANIQV